jgi:hypothetical protein
MNDNNGWPGKSGVPLNPERDGAHRLRHSESGLERDSLWLCGGTWVDSDGEFSIQHAALFYIYLGPCLTPAEVDARVAAAHKEWLAELNHDTDALMEAARRLEELHKNHKYKPETGEGSEHDTGYYRAIAEGVAHIRALSGTPPGTYTNEAEQERDEFFNRLGRITEELNLPMDATASRIIEAVRERVDNEREECASVSVKVVVPDGAETWTPLEAWEGALLVFDEAFRNAIRSRALSDTPTGMVLVPRDREDETRAAKILAERNQLIGILQVAVEQSQETGENEPAWLGPACRILNAGFTKAVKTEEIND